MLDRSEVTICPGFTVGYQARELELAAPERPLKKGARPTIPQEDLVVRPVRAALHFRGYRANPNA